MTTLAWAILLLAVAVICVLARWLADERATVRTQADLLDEKAKTIAAKDQAIDGIGQRLASMEENLCGDVADLVRRLTAERAIRFKAEDDARWLNLLVELAFADEPRPDRVLEVARAL